MNRLDLRPPPASQRWRQRRSTWVRPERPLFDPAGYRVDRCSEADAKPFVVEHHYSGSFPAARFAYRLDDRRSGQLVGVAVYGIPASARVLTGPFPDLEPYVESLELSRLVLLDDVAYNAESWFVARAHHDLAGRGVRGVVAFADPMPRHTADGRVITPGHAGVVYQALNFRLAGATGPRRLTVLPDGTTFSDRAAQKVRSGDRGHDYAERRLVTLGATPLNDGEDPRRWLADALATVGARRLSHPGNHRYCTTLGARRTRQQLADAHGARPATSLRLW